MEQGNGRLNSSLILSSFGGMENMV
jgi:hypothetical protein